MKLQLVENTNQKQITPAFEKQNICNFAKFGKVEILTNANKAETIELLNNRPVHTTIMVSFINKNGLESENNRGDFYGFRNNSGQLEAIALIGHTTLVEANSEYAIAALALTAQNSKKPIKVMMSDGNSIETFWNYYAKPGQKPKHNFTELLFELSFPFSVNKCEWDVRPAKADELLQVADAQAEVAFLESGINPLETDREGFLQRCLKRIESGNTFVVFQDGKLIFKVDLVAETEKTAYLEGFYVNSDLRYKGIGNKCLSEVSLNLLNTYENICGLCNEQFVGTHKSLAKAGFVKTDSCQTIFV